MAYQFNKKPTASFQFTTNADSSDKTKLAGINATIGSAATICDGVSSLMAIGGNSSVYTNAIRTATETVYNDEEG